MSNYTHTNPRLYPKSTYASNFKDTRNQEAQVKQGDALVGTQGLPFHIRHMPSGQNNDISGSLDEAHVSAHTSRGF